jgi:hypothetical protein
VHLDPQHTSAELATSGAVLAMILSLDEAGLVVGRMNPSAVARQSKFRTRVPPDRLLVESDHGYRDPPVAIPCRVEWVEHLMGQQLGLDAPGVRRLAWRNLAAIIRLTSTWRLLPEPMATILADVSE